MTVANIVARIAAHVSDNAQKLALDDGDTTLTYHELWTAASVVRLQMDAAAGEAEMPVYVCLHRSTQMIVAFLAGADGRAAGHPFGSGTSSGT